MGRREDAALAGGALLAVGLAAGALAAPLDPTAALLGAVGAVALEWALSLEARRVREVWARLSVRLAAVALTAAGGAAATRVFGPRALSALGGGLGAYLLALGWVSIRERAVPRLRRS
ncbi:MAG: hypothetical protein ABEJ28_06855 [Salinigranum sp.]